MPKELKEKLIREVQEKKKEYVSDVLTKHKKYNEDLKSLGSVKLFIRNDESSGTKKVFRSYRSLFSMLLKMVYTLVVDEF